MCVVLGSYLQKHFIMDLCFQQFPVYTLWIYKLSILAAILKLADTLKYQ